MVRRRRVVRSAGLFVSIFFVVPAATVLVLASRTPYLGLKGPIQKHRQLTPITSPIWIYVSITGVLVYLLLFQFYGPAA